MITKSRQLKDLVRNISKGDSVKAQTIIRNYMMERFLERLSLSPYRENIILKGGMLMVAAIGVHNRSTMDIDAAFKKLHLTEDTAKKVIEEIIAIKLDDGVFFEIKSISVIMDEADYRGIRITLDALLENMRVSFKVDFSTGDVITPQETSCVLKLFFEERVISILAYNFETVLAEKIETIFARGTANTRMRDFYDIFALNETQARNIDKDILKEAFINTSQKRGSLALIDGTDLILHEIASSPEMAALWANYRRKFDYAANITWSDVIRSVEILCKAIV